MTTGIKIRQALFKFVSPSTPVEQRLRFSCGEFPEAEGLSHEDRLTVLFILSHDKDAAVSGLAKKTVGDYPVYNLLNALEGELAPAVIRHIVATHDGNEAIEIMAAINPLIDDETLLKVVERGPEEVVRLIIEDKERLAKNPLLLDAMKKNPSATQGDISRAEAALAGGRAEGETREAASPPRPLHKAAKEEDKEIKRALKEEKPLKDGEQNIYKLLQDMNTSQKIKFALTGNKSAREVLAKEANKLIAMSVLKNPRITEDEVMRLATSKSTPDDMLRCIARNREWVKGYGLKLALVANPKTPLTVSVKMLDHVYDKDLEKIAKSKNIPSVLASTARRKLEAKAKK